MNSKALDELETAIAAIDAEIAAVRFDPRDRADMKRAIRRMEQVVDAKVALHQDNPTLRGIAAGLKHDFRERLLRRAEEEIEAPST